MVRAYTSATQKAIEEAELVTEEPGVVVQIEVNYPQTDFVKYYCKKENIEIQNVFFEETVKFQLLMTKLEYERIQKLEKTKIKIESMEILEEKNIRKRQMTDIGKK